jgi:hypothetical protein
MLLKYTGVVLLPIYSSIIRAFAFIPFVYNDVIKSFADKVPPQIFISVPAILIVFLDKQLDGLLLPMHKSGSFKTCQYY